MTFHIPKATEDTVQVCESLSWYSQIKGHVACKGRWNICALSIVSFLGVFCFTQEEA